MLFNGHYQEFNYMKPLRFRQVHLDFHTAPQIAAIGAAFDKAQWQAELRNGHVDSITLFAVCHHGWNYNNTEVGCRHPQLDFDLLRAQFEATKEIDINAPIYLSAGVNDRIAAAEPGWREVTAAGGYAGWSVNPLQAGFKKLCYNTPYLDYLCRLIEEVVRDFPGCDGIFLDAATQGPCCCPRCFEAMLAKGLDPSDPADRAPQARQTLLNYLARTKAAATGGRADMPLFHNNGHITKGDHEVLEPRPTWSWYAAPPCGQQRCATQVAWQRLRLSRSCCPCWTPKCGYRSMARLSV